MKVLMVGAGSVGGYFGARLVKAGVDCAFLLRPRTLAAVKQRGLTVHSVDQSFTVHPVASSNPRDLPKADLVILSVKRFDLDEVIEQLRPVLFASASTPFCKVSTVAWAKSTGLGCTTRTKGGSSSGRVTTAARAG